MRLFFVKPHSIPLLVCSGRNVVCIMQAFTYLQAKEQCMDEVAWAWHVTGFVCVHAQIIMVEHDVSNHREDRRTAE